MRDDLLHRDLVIENVSSIPIFPHLGHPLFSVPTSNKAAAGGQYFKNPLVTPTSVFSKSDNQPNKKMQQKNTSGCQPVVMRSTRQ